MKACCKLYCISFFFAVLLMAGCIDAPNPVGISTLPGSDFSLGRVDTFYATGHSSLLNQLYTTALDRFMLGKYLSYEAWTCLKFYQWPDSLIGASVTGATIQIKRSYSFGDSTSSISFNVYNAKANLFGDSLTVDSLSLFGDLYYQEPPINSSLNVIGDTVYNFNIDTAIVREWLTANTDTVNYGLVFRPGNSSAIKGFYSYLSFDTTYEPKLYISYIDTSGNSGIYMHTFSRSRYVSTFDSTSLDNNLINVQNGISYRGLISFDELLTTWPVKIHGAILQITLDSAKCSSNFVPYGTPFANNSLYALSVDANGKSDGMNIAPSVLSTDALGRSVYTFNIRLFADRWITNTAVRKVALTGAYEPGTFDLFAFYGSGYSNTIKPRVIITYSIQY